MGLAAVKKNKGITDGDLRSGNVPRAHWPFANAHLPLPVRAKQTFVTNGSPSAASIGPWFRRSDIGERAIDRAATAMLPANYAAFRAGPRTCAQNWFAESGFDPLRDLISEAPDDLTLVCQIRGGLCALPLTRVVETMRPLPVEPVAGAPAFVSGLAIIRGAAVPVVDATRLLTSERADMAGSDHAVGRFVTVRAGGRLLALAVTDVVGVRSIPVESRGTLPGLLSRAASEVIATVGALDADLLVVLQAGHLLPEGFAER